MSGPFDFIAAINESKKDLMAEGETGYNSFITNRALSYFPDTIMYALEMSKLSHLDLDMQFQYLRQAVRKRRRFSKWVKSKSSEDIDAVQHYYNYSRIRAEEATHILTRAQLDILKKATAD